MRSYLRQHLIRAWCSCIRNDYNQQKINSERTLQAAFWCRLARGLKPQMRLFIEPVLRLDTDRSVIPDIVVCNTRSLICIIELKYLPRVLPRTRKDIDNLCEIATLCQQGHQIEFEHRRYRGKHAAPARYRLVSSTLHVWAGIHADDDCEHVGNFSEECTALEGRYLQLQAITREAGPPDILVNGIRVR